MARPDPPDTRFGAIPGVRIWQLEGIGEVIRGPVPAPMPKVVHEDLLIGVMQTGVVNALYRGASHTLHNGALILGQPGEGAAFEPVTGDSHPIRVCMRCPLSMLQQVANEVADRRTPVPFFPAFVIPDPALAGLFLSFQRTLEVPTARLESSSRFHDMLTWIIRRHTSPPPADRKIGREHALVRRVREYLDAHYADSIDLDDLARMVNLSPFHLNHVFRTEVGLPPHAYQTQVRVTRSKSLLAQGLAIRRIAVDVGFFDQSHFTNHFKRLLGFTPGTYQRSILGTRSGRTGRGE